MTFALQVVDRDITSLSDYEECNIQSCVCKMDGSRCLQRRDGIGRLHIFCTCTNQEAQADGRQKLNKIYDYPNKERSRFALQSNPVE